MNLDDAQTRARFAAARVARLATVSADGAPRLVPVTFAALGPSGDFGTLQARGTIVTAVDHKPKRSTRLRRLEDIARQPRVTLLADEYDDDWTRLWWARADGLAHVVEPPDPAYMAAVRALAARYAQYREHPPAGPAIVVAVTRWSGWAFTDPGPDGVSRGS
ncbi:TIGR03668 family PPOX class F420-dependent oxidoreductase [Frankia sp. CNm7]|uniref:TIGR03668 family PPOX class F420-dependent oxidoreductase n=1 Tax=Frankia nepalensis TaxID=1836974 RepID=A0A937RKI7_9ACTN|nr:TIGR03668 family PPOX class F420-dependent oxidoreductase [Frankia nepalensis]MBL7496324.1 TIGR03668 family PPOX class F420-dependent oxidoreductase [Frankia nepalensis]MBL7508479.1 TIGR03668 family PPOX class F420-dependent oxidoreductase [Frankia nepalensis]MBL7521643.1 TIGR03668 family PPOX class F420-dependent oxidoreductase [Frankia nepalensis]MBL7627611.1 TIGR03668 family PPOX class F420-dependent oxidoreductase [Frankia nepalensis]